MSLYYGKSNGQYGKRSKMDMDLIWIPSKIDMFFGKFSIVLLWKLSITQTKQRNINSSDFKYDMITKWLRADYVPVIYQLQSKYNTHNVMNE